MNSEMFIPKHPLTDLGLNLREYSFLILHNPGNNLPRNICRIDRLNTINLIKYILINPLILKLWIIILNYIIILDIVNNEQ